VTQAADERVRQASLIFTGSVESIGATTTEAFAASGQTAVVTVIDVIRAPRAFSRLAGQLVTVVLREAGQPPPGSTAVFYTNTHLIADSLVLEESSHEPVPDATARPEGLSDALAAHDDAPLARRLGEAQVVILGRVSNVRPSVAETAAVDVSGPLGEHDPQWSEAVVAVDSVLKGAVTGPVVIVYPASIDVVWHHAPKYHAGQSGVFLLHSTNVPEAAAAQYPNAYTSLHSADFVPAADAARVRALLAQNG
jgi:hypothetical protein